MNSGCATGILIDISNVDVPTTSVLPTSKVAAMSPMSRFATSVRLNDTFPAGILHDVAGHFNDVKVMDNKDGSWKSSESFIKIDADSELLENETFDFDELLNSPDSCINTDKETEFPCTMIGTNGSDKLDTALNSEQLAEIFKEATLVAVKLENYALDLNRTPQKSPNLTALLVERSTQKKRQLIEEHQQRTARPKLEQDINMNLTAIFDSEPSADLNETVVLEAKTFQDIETESELPSNPSHQPENERRVQEPPHSENQTIESSRFKSPLQRPLMRKILVPASNSVATFSRRLQQNRSEVAMSSPQKCEPIKVTISTVPKQLKFVERPSSVQANPRTLSVNPSSAIDRKKSTSTISRASSFNAGSRIPTRPVLKRSNSTVSPNVPDSKSSSRADRVGHKSVNRRSVVEKSSASPSLNTTSVLSSSCGPSSRTNDAKRIATPTFNMPKKFKSNDC